jgi:translocator protein
MRSILLLSLLASASFEARGFQPRLHEIKTVKTSITSPIVQPKSLVTNSRQTNSLWASTTDEAPEVEGELDVDAMAKYAAALAIQMGLFSGIFFAFDKIVAATGVEIPFAANCIFFYFCALKSRVLNPLSNSRPSPATREVPDAEQRKMPSWTPPGFIFPIVWLLLIGPLRAYTTALIYSVNGHEYASFAILSLMFHLSIGDIWNTINNVERRYGTSVLGIACVYASAAFASYSYYQVLPQAGQLLALKMIWLTIASSLIIQTWRLNPNPKTGEKYSLLPRKEGGAKTEFMWFSEN